MPVFPRLAALAVLGLTTACAEWGDTATWDWGLVERNALLDYAQSYSETPFALGAMDIVAVENDELKTFRLVPCRGGAQICADNLNGPAGTLQRTPEYWIVSGIYGGRSFYLSPGGDGAIYYGSNRAASLAWNNIAEE
jgi:hypothetical protein